MKVKISIKILFATQLILFLISFYTGRNASAHTNGAPSLECDNCHFGAEDKIVEVIVEGLPKEFQPNKTYTVKISIKSDNESYGDNQGGFAVTASAGQLIVIDKVNTQLSNGFITHTNEGSKTREWKFAWKAPSKKIEQVDISIMAVAANGDYSPNMDAVGVETLKIKLKK